MKFWIGLNNELTPQYEKVKVQNDIRNKQTNIPNFQLCYPCKCLARYARSPNHHIYYERMYVWCVKRCTHNAMMPHPLYEMCLTCPMLNCAILYRQLYCESGRISAITR